jgi:hypothetical protein
MLVVASYRTWSSHEQMMTPAKHQDKIVILKLRDLRMV